MAGQQCRDAFLRRDHEEAVRLLRLQDPEVLHRDELGLLYYSISNGWLDVIRDLITNYRFDPHKYYSGESCLYTAAKGNHVDIVEYLIKECGCDPMMPDVVKYLINEYYCALMATNKYGQTPLHDAARLGTPEVVEYLLSTGNCDPLAKDNMGRTPLQLAKRRVREQGISRRI
ncbi:PREDICTED: espin-like [Amphimedon queenslandica]|uniref:Ankyrin repeat protein n=1 Tax=Amphimedon queenslandica TaxID=400682 RepID=A0AAN0JT95_AMPQE|nr:PREDICTED: espin-like [Amphimedon queenslandica]|eukprot:XP_019860266.1 PREDICTED: espin-like [Amphimedon queenslandica]